MPPSVVSGTNILLTMDDGLQSPTHGPSDIGLETDPECMHPLRLPSIKVLFNPHLFLEDRIIRTCDVHLNLFIINIRIVPFDIFTYHSDPDLEVSAPQDSSRSLKLQMLHQLQVA